MRIIHIPANIHEPITERDLPSFAYPALNNFLDVAMIERVTTQALYDLWHDADTRSMVIMICNENGWAETPVNNVRAQILAGHDAIPGNVALMAEGQVADDEGYPEIDFIGLPHSVFVSRVIDLISANDNRR